MKVTRLGQAGLRIDTPDAKILVDPYFTDSAFEISGVHRKKEAPDWVWDIKPDILLVTHDHIDHYDPETAKRFVNENTAVTVLSPRSVWEKIKLCGGNNNFVLVSPGVRWSCGGTAVTALSAVHSDPFAVGFAISAEGKTVCITGDTLFSEAIGYPFESADYMFLPINGRGNNMNALDAAALAEKYKVKRAVPVHYGMLDSVAPDIFEYAGKYVMEDFREYEI